MHPHCLRRVGLRATAIALTTISFAVAAPALADDTKDDDDRSEAERLADEVLVTATRRAASSFDVPASTTVIDAARATRERLRRTFPDLLLDVPGVMVQRTAYGQASPYIRGFTGYQTVLLFDGIRVNNAVFRSGPNQYWSTIDPFTVDRVEVARGPSSVLYGSDAVGGAVNALPRRRTSFEPGLHAQVSNFSRWSSAERSWTNRTELSANQDDLGVTAGGTYRSYGDLRAGGDTGRLPGTGYRDTDGDLRLDWRQDRDTTITFAAQHVDQDRVPRTHTTVDAVPFHGTDVGTELRRDHFQTRDLVYGRWASERPPLAFADRMEATLSWQRQRETRIRDRDGGRRDVQGFDDTTFGLQAQFESDTRAGRLTYGIEFWHDDVVSFRDDFTNGALVLREVQGPVGDRASYDLLGIYGQDEFELGATTITAGARFTHATADADRVDNPLVGGADPATRGNVIGVRESWNNAVGSLRAVHPLSGGWNVFGGASQAFRAPSLSDLTVLDATSGFETPAPGLDPERYLTLEIGAKGRGDGWGVQGGFWWTDIDGMIVASPTGRRIDGTPEVRKDNIGDGWAEGVELEGYVDLDSAWRVSLAASWMDGEVDQLTDANVKVRAPLSRLQPLSTSLTATYTPTPGGFVFWVSGRAVQRADKLSLKDTTDTQRIPPSGTPRYAVVSLGMRTRLSADASLSVAVENVGDTNHRIHGSGVNEAGRNLVLALDLEF